MMRFDFDRREPLIFRLVPWMIGAAWLCSLVAIIALCYAVATMDPRDVGSFFGEIVSGFNQASKERT